MKALDDGRLTEIRAFLEDKSGRFFFLEQEYGEVAWLLSMARELLADRDYHQHIHEQTFGVFTSSRSRTFTAPALDAQTIIAAEPIPIPIHPRLYGRA